MTDYRRPRRAGTFVRRYLKLGRDIPGAFVIDGSVCANFDPVEGYCDYIFEVGDLTIVVRFDFATKELTQLSELPEYLK